MSNMRKISLILAAIRELDVPTFLGLADSLNVDPHELSRLVYRNVVNLAVAPENPKVIQTIKFIRDNVNLGLKESKDIVDQARSSGAPVVFMEGIEYDEANRLYNAAASAGVNLVILR